MNNYFENITNYSRVTRDGNGYLTETPTKNAVLDNAKIDGATSILPGSNNRALIIKKGNYIFLQSYDTIICSINIKSGYFRKFWNDYSNTTMRHVETFLNAFAPGKRFNKKTWLAYKTSKL